MADQRDQPRASGSRGPHRDIPPSSSSGRTKDADSTRRDHQDTVDEAASARAEPASERSEDEDGYEVEAILDEKKDKHGRTLYYIKWKGWDESWNEWIPHEDTSCPELIAEFRRSKLKKRKKEKKLKSEDSQTPRKRRTPDNAAEEQEDTAGSSRASNGATQQASKSKPSAAIVNRCRNPPDEETMALDRLRPYPPSDSVSKPPRPPSPSPPMSVVEAPVPEPVVAEPIPVKVLTQRSTNIGDAFYCVLWSDGVETWERINHMNKYVDLLIEFETAGPRKDRRERTTVPFSVNAPSRLGGSAGSQRQTAANPLSKKSAPDSVQKKADPRALSKGASPKPFPKRAGSPAGTPAKAPLPKRHKSLPISYESDDEDQAAVDTHTAQQHPEADMDVDMPGYVADSDPGFMETEVVDSGQQVISTLSAAGNQRSQRSKPTVKHRNMAVVSDSEDDGASPVRSIAGRVHQNDQSYSDASMSSEEFEGNRRMLLLDSSQEQPRTSAGSSRRNPAKLKKYQAGTEDHMRVCYYCNSRDSKDELDVDSKLHQCQGCTISFHQNCNHNHVHMCDFCRTGKLSDCGLCGKTTVIEPGTKPPAFRCHRCYLPWHLECMNTLELPPIGRYRHNHKWSCCFCQSIPANVKTILTYTEDWSNTSEALGDIYKRVAKVYSDHPFRLYLVKLENTAYRWALWVPDWWISRVCEPKLLAFLKAALQSPGLHPRPKSAVIMEEWTHVSRILQFKSRTQKYTHSAPRNIASIDEVLVSWKGLDIETSTWESWPTPEDAEYQEFVDSWKRELELENRLSVKSLPLPKAFRPPDEKTPEFLNNCTLKHYQIEGVGWLLYNHFHTVSSILADEMGLGKTLQIATFIGHLIKTYNRFPHLIVAPLSLIDHWIREFKRWTPWIEVVSYCGEKASKKMVYDHLMFLDKRRSRMRCHVIISTYEIMQNESQLFRFVPFETLICDEGHRIKNDSTKTYAAIQANIKAAHKVVMTGTPLQNNLKELHNLMCFLDPAKFANSSWRDNKIEDLSEESVKTLHDELVPYILRRTKAKYMSDLPPKIERFVPVSLTPLQRKIYKLALMKNVWLFNPDTKKGQPEQALRRTLADLRLLCIHPFIEEDNEIAYFKENYPELVKLDPMDSRRIAKMIEVSGKLELLSKMLRKLKQNGNKVLIFSQFKLALNILEDFLDFERYKFVRMDGETTQSDRVDVIGKFEDANSDVFVFLLTTRTGGLGLNLVAADTVIIFDPDWNPQLDKQAVARAHRIGQTRPVCIYRLFTQHSVEEKIMEIGKSKIILEHLIVQKMDESLDKNEVQDILKFGAQSIFSENSPKAIVYDDESVDKLLDRTVTEEQKAAAEAEELMSFEVAKVWTENGDEQAKKSEEELDQEIWKQIQIEIEHNKQQRLEQYAIDESGGRAKRASRMDINYRESQQRHRVEDVARLDPEFVPVDSSSSSDDTLPEDQDDDMIGVDKVQAKPDPRATKTTRPGLPLRTAQPAAAASAAPVRAPITQTGFTVMISPSPLVYFCCWLCGEPTYHPVESCPKALDYHHLQLCRGILTQQLQLNLGSIMELNAKIYLVDCWMKRLRPQPHVSMAPPSTPTVAALPGTAAVAAAIPEPGPSAAPPNKGGNASSVNQSHSSAGPASTPSQPPKPVPAQQSSTPNRAQKPTLLADREPLAAASNPTTAAPLPLSSNNNNTPSTPAAVANRPAAANQPPTRKSAATTPTSALPASLISLIGSLKKRESPSSVAKPVQPAQNAKAILDELFKGSAASEERNEPNIPPQGPAAPVVAQASSHQGAIAAGLVGIPVTTISPTARPAESAPIGTTNEAQVQKAMTENGSGRFEQLSPGLPTTAQPLRAPQGNVCELCGENGHRVIECVAAKKDPRRMEQVARERQAQGLISPAQMSVISKTIELFRGRRDALESSAAAAQNDIEMI